MPNVDIPGGNPPMRPDQELQPVSRAGTGPAPSGTIVRAREVIISGPSGGMFVYNATQTALESANVGAATTDPILGHAVPAGFSTFNAFGAVINLLSTANDAFFQYQDHGSAVQGALILSVASTAGTDPVDGTSYPVGLFGVDPAFGDSLQTLGASISFGQVPYTRNADVIAHGGSGSANPYLLVDAPEQTTASHMQMQLQGESPDATRPPQLLIGQVSGAAVLSPNTPDMLEVQGGTGQTVAGFLGDATTTLAITVRVITDANTRTTIRSDGRYGWGGGVAVNDSFLAWISANRMGFQTCDLAIRTAGRGLQVSEGANGKQGTATLAAGTVTVANTSVTASSRIFLTAQDNNSTGALRVSARTAGTSFTITSSNAADSGVVAFEIFEPG